MLEETEVTVYGWSAVVVKESLMLLGQIIPNTEEHQGKRKIIVFRDVEIQWR